MAKTVSVLPPTGTDGGVEEPCEPAAAAEGVDEFEPVHASPLPSARAASEALPEVGHRVVERLRHHFGPGGQALEQAVVAEFPALDQERRQPAHQVARILEDRVGEIHTGEDPPGVTADRVQRVLREPGHEGLVDGRLDPAWVHHRVPRRETVPCRFGSRMLTAHGAEQPDHLARRRADEVHLRPGHVREVDDPLAEELSDPERPVSRHVVGADVEGELVPDDAVVRGDDLVLRRVEDLRHLIHVQVPRPDRIASPALHREPAGL